MKLKLGEIAHIQFGLHCSDLIEKGEIKYIQAKNFDENAFFSHNTGNYINLDEKDKNHLLQDGDVLFVGKGTRNFAWTYQKEFGAAIASSTFFVIKLNTNFILPDYLTTVLNSIRYQNIYQQLGAGSSIQSIRKPELEALIFNIPPLEIQQKIADLKAKHLEDVALSIQIIAEKKTLFNTIINKVINE